MIWEFINPSDAIVFEADDEELAALVTIIVGRGQYGARCGDISVGMFSFAPREDCHKWFKKRFGRDADASYELRKAELPGVLRSFMLGNEDDLVCYHLALEHAADKQAFKKAWKEVRRSSMNDICGFAWQAANNLEGKNDNMIPEPRSVFSH